MTEREELLDTLGHHVSEARRLVSALRWAGKENKALNDLQAKVNRELSKEWRKQVDISQ